MTKVIKILCSLVLLNFASSSFLMSQGNVCNDRINVSVNHNCAIDLTVDAFLEEDLVDPNDVLNGDYTYEIYNHNGVIVQGGINGPTYGGEDLSGYVNSLVFFRIYYNNALTCGGTVLLEDKQEPIIDCSVCPKLNGQSAIEYNPECIRNCFEQDLIQLQYDKDLRDRIIDEDIEDFIDDYVTDNCNNWDIHLSGSYDFWTNYGPCVGARLQRTWNISYYDYNNQVNTISCVREYFFQPFRLDQVKEYPLDFMGNSQLITPIENCLILPIELVNVPCSEDLSPAGIARYYDDPDTEDRDSDDNNIDPDEYDVDLVIENNEGVPYGFPHFYTQGVGARALHPQPIDNELCNLITGYTDNALDACQPGCLGNRKILRNWTILDWCSGQFVTYGQIIKAVDQYGPELDVPEITASVDPWNCEATVHLPHPEHIFDNCDNFYGYSIGSTGGYEVIGDVHSGYRVKNVPLGTHTIEYVSEDCCGNVGRTYVTLHVVDNTPPVAVSKEFVVLSLTNIGNPINGYQGTAKIFAYDLDNGSYDGCSDVTLKIRRSPVCRNADASWGDYVTFCCEDLEGVSAREIDVELLIRDDNGNENKVWSTVRLEDKSEAFPATPPHMIVTCDMSLGNLDLTGGIPEYFGACGQGVVACDTASVLENTVPRELRLSDGVVINGQPMQAPAYNVNCGSGALRRTFKDCGGGIQWLIVLPVDPFDNTAIVWPEDVVVDCNNYDNGEPGWPETTCNLVGVSLESDTFMFDGNSCMKILNHWAIIDWCLYDPTNPNSFGKYEYTQVVKIIDTLDPIISTTDSVCYNVLDACVSQGIELEASAIDVGDCGSRWLRWELSVDIDANWTEDYFYTSESNRYLSNGDENIFHIPRSGNDETVTAYLPDGIGASNIWHRAIWRVYDGCGNTSSRLTYFQLADKKAPTPYCLNLSTAVMQNGEVELWAIDLNQGSFDNCSHEEALIFTFTDVLPPPRNDSEYDSNADLQWYNGNFWYYNSESIDDDTGAGEYEKIGDYGNEVHRWEPGLRSAGKIFTTADADSSGMIEVPIYVWDENGNVDFCLVNLRIVDNGGGGMAMVAGTVHDEMGSPVENVVTELNGTLNFHLDDLTDHNGDYAFPNTPQFSDYDVLATKNDDYMNGVSTLDLIIIQRHILGLEHLRTAYKMIAADINNDKSVSVIDLVELRKLILGIYQELPNNGSWKMVDADNNLTALNPWGYESVIGIQELVDDKMEEDFIGVKIGDVNNSVVVNSQPGSEDVEKRLRQEFVVNAMDIEMKENEEYTVVLKMPKLEMRGFQMQLNANGAEFIEFKSKKLNEEHYVLTPSELTISYDNVSADNLEDMQIKLMAQSNIALSEVLSLSNYGLKAESYDIDLNTLELKLNIVNNNPIVDLRQNQPNPFFEETLISFYLPESGNIEMSFTDVDGRLIQMMTGYYEKGEHIIKVNAITLNGPGLVFYTLKTQNTTITKQMVLAR